MPTTRSSIRTALADPTSFAATLVAAALAEFGTEFLGWDPATVRHELAEAAGAAPPPSQFDRLMAGVAVLTAGRFHRSLPDFIAIATALNGDGHSPGLWDPPGCEDIAWALTESGLILRMVLGAGEGPEEFSAEIRRFIGLACQREGLVEPPDVLRLGTLPDDRAARIMASYTDDPAAYAAIREAQDARNAAILAELRGRMRLLLGQLAALWAVTPDEATRIVAAAK